MRFSARLSTRLAAISIASLTFVVVVGGPATTGCLTSELVVSDEAGLSGEAGPPAVTVEGSDPSTNTQNADSASVHYLDINSHPGCTINGLATRAPAGTGSGGPYNPVNIPGYKCAAKGYPVQNEDKSKPILLLIHGNSDSPTGWEAWPTGTGSPQLAETASGQGFRTLAVDFRVDLVPVDTTNNPAQNFDHGWAVPIAEAFFDAVFNAFPDRKVSIVGFSLGPTIIRDALRRLHREKKKPFEHIRDLVLLAGANHGVSSYRKLCGPNPSMAGSAACELGDLAGFTPTPFLTPLNGPGGAFEAPCVDGDNAYGQKGVCGGNKVRITTIVMHDKDDGTYQDEFVSQTSSKLAGANNLTIPVGNPDVSGYFAKGFLDDHYGSSRSAAALALIMQTLNQP